MTIIRKNWTEDEITAFAFESDTFERKSGQLIESDFDKTVAKVLSAFSNTNGGHIVFGVRDDGTFDGVPLIAKGRTRSVDWLRSKISDLLAPSLKDFRIHIVDQSDNSGIPAGRIVIVVDIAKSELAPHQSTVDFRYYQRIGSSSTPLPHRHLELLFAREKFPGPKVATAWMQSVINPLLSQLALERYRLREESWGFDVHRHGKLKCVNLLFGDYCIGNGAQFLQNYQDIQGLIDMHDRKVSDFLAIVDQNFVLMCESARGFQFYAYFTSEAMLQPLKDEQRCTKSYDFRNCTTRSDFIQKLFPSDDEYKNTEFLVAYILNNTPKNSEATYAPLWDLHRDIFVNGSLPHFKEPLERIRSEAKAVLEIAKSLASTLEQTRDDLCFKHGLPYEEIHQTVVQIPTASSMLYDPTWR